MVRFIIRNIRKKIKNSLSIYIPIWLDLLLNRNSLQKKLFENLHSNMVRFIIISF